MKPLFFIGFLAAALFLGGCQEEYVHVGPNWNALHQLAPNKKEGFRVKVGGPKTADRGERMHFEIESEREGRLWVIQADSADALTVLFPNEAEKENTVRAGESFQVPPKTANWAIQAGEPVGKSIIAFVVTAPGTDLGHVLPRAAPDQKKSLRVVPKAAAWGVDTLVVDIE